MRILSIILLLLCGSVAFAGQQKYGSFILDSDTPDTLFFIDEIKPGDSFELRKALRNHNVKNVVLASPGGSVFEGLQMAGILFDRKLRTYIPEGSVCVSACAFLFFAGNERLAEGKLGVHQTYSSNFSEEKAIGQTQYVTQFTVSEIIGFLNEFGTPAFVYERMFQDIDMYYFNDDELSLLNSGSFTLTADEQIKLLNTNEQLSKTSNENSSNEPEVSESGDYSPKTKEPADTTEVEKTRKLLIRKIQTRLKEIGCNPGAIDGIWGKRTRAAAELFTKQTGLKEKPVSFITQEFLDRLLKAEQNSCSQSAPSNTSVLISGVETWEGWEDCPNLSGGKYKRKITLYRRQNGNLVIELPRPEENSYEVSSFPVNLGNLEQRFGDAIKRGDNVDTEFNYNGYAYKLSFNFQRGIISGRYRDTNPMLKIARTILLSSSSCEVFYRR